MCNQGINVQSSLEISSLSLLAYYLLYRKLRSSAEKYSPIDVFVSEYTAWMLTHLQQTCATIFL